MLAWEDSGLRERQLRATNAVAARRRLGGSVASAGRRLGVRPGVRGTGSRIVTAVSVSGPIERLTRPPAACTPPPWSAQGSR